MNKRKLIVLEGTDGAGKSTQIKLIQKYLESKNLKSEFIHFPMYGDNEFSDLISKFLRGEFGDINEVDPYFVANIYAMDRFLYSPKLEEKLKNNDVLLLDRYVFSNAAFQGAKYDDPFERISMIDWILKFEFNFLQLSKPDLTLFLDVPINTVEKRLSEERSGDDREYLNGNQDIHEKDITFQEKVRNVFLNDISRLYERHIESELNYEIVDCEVMGKLLSPEELFYSYKNIIDKTINSDD